MLVYLNSSTSKDILNTIFLITGVYIYMLVYMYMYMIFNYT